jgi:hypothetical protein
MDLSQDRLLLDLEGIYNYFLINCHVTDTKNMYIIFDNKTEYNFEHTL